MPYNTFSVGSDCQVVVMGPFGRVDLAHVTGFESHQLTVAVRVDRTEGMGRRVFARSWFIRGG